MVLHIQKINRALNFRQKIKEQAFREAAKKKSLSLQDEKLLDAIVAEYEKLA